MCIRDRYLRQQLEVLPPEDFQSQYLCIPQHRRPGRRVVQALAAPEVIHGARAKGVQPPSVGVVGAVEDWHGTEAGAALAWLDTDEQPVMVGRRFDTLDQAFMWVSRFAQEVLVGYSLRGLPQAQLLAAKGVGTRETTSALPLLRRLLRAGTLSWDGDDLATQLVELGVVERSEGGLKVDRGQHFIVRPAAWAVQQLTNAPAVAAAVL
jgi:hypothetical protein